MKRNLVQRLLCISIASTMLLSNTVNIYAQNGTEEPAAESVMVASEGEEAPAAVVSETTSTEPAITSETVQETETVVDPEVPSEPTPDADNTEVVPDAGTTEPAPNSGDTEVTPDAGTTPEPTPDAGDAEVTPDTGTTEPTPGEGDTEVTPDAGTTEPTPDAGESEVVPEATPDTEVKPDTGKVETPKKEEAKPSASKETQKSSAKKPVYIPPTVTAGTGFYVNELEDTYKLSFAENFGDVMAEIESEFITAKLNEKVIADLVEDIHFTNWSDVLALHLMYEELYPVEQEVVLGDLNLENLEVEEKLFVMDEEDKANLTWIFDLMNDLTLDEEGNAIVTSDTLFADDEWNDDYTEEEQEFLSKYISADCKLLCASATGLDGFIYSSLGDELSAERVNIVKAAYSLVGKVSYFWGGKSTSLGWDSRWGTYRTVTAEGAVMTGAVCKYGLDCSGFVSWAFINGYEDKAVQNQVGNGTASQWGKSYMINEADALPGDLVFLQAPGNDGINHVGIVVGHDDNGKLVVVHCNADDNGVVVESAYQAGFRYVRRPVVLD